MALPDIPGFTAIGSAVAMYDYTDGQPGDLCFPAGVPRAGGMMCAVDAALSTAASSISSTPPATPVARVMVARC